MIPRVEKQTENGNTLTFTLQNVNVSVANSVRRTILSDIPTVVFKTSPHDQNKTSMITNTTRLNNEILKQRLSCIPIHIADLKMPLHNYVMEINVENLTDTIMFVTTKDFKIKNLTIDEYLKETDRDAIFPPDVLTGYYIDFARLRPKISEEIPGEKLHLISEFSIATAKEDGMFNVVSTCSYGFTQDDAEIEDLLRKKAQEWKDKGMTKEEIAFESKNWRLLDGQRIVTPNSFDFIVQTVGVYTCQHIVRTACDIMMEKLELMDGMVESDDLSIAQSNNTMKHCYDIILKNEDYTLGKVIEYYLYSKFYEGFETLSFCGFKKMHPHDSDSIIRIAYKEDVDKMMIKQNLKECIADAMIVYTAIRDKF